MGRPPTISREQLLAAARHIFAAKGFEAATLADIARELHVTPSAVLRHVPSKRALFAEAMNRRIEPPAFIMELASVDATEDPRIVLRRIAEQFIPFASRVVAENIVVYMHARTQRSLLVPPFDPTSNDSPPRRGIRVVESYFRRAAKAGVITIDDPRAAARLFIGSLHSYVLLHHVLNIPPYPVDAYIDALIELWTHGGIRGPQKTKRRSPGDHRGRSRGGGGRNARLPAPGAKAARARSVGNAGGEDGERRVARRRPHRPRAHR
jgi:AcrR family transcriptional regulator